MSRLDRLPLWGRLLLLLGLLTVFLVAVKCMGSSFKLVGKDTAASLFNGISSPFAGLAVGILATVLVQSSSATTSLIVGLVGAGQMSVAIAVPMVMGANIGTSITNTLVSLGHITRSAEFRRAFAGATMHDFFNVICVIILLPLELATGFLQKGAAWLTQTLTFGGMHYKSPVKKFIGAICDQVQGFVTGVLGLEGWPAAITLMLFGVAALIVALLLITRTMRGLVAGRMEHALNTVLGKSGILAIAVGAVITVSVQSSSITTSLLIPLIGAGILSLEVAFPITLGANIGTTITGLLASLATDHPAGLTIALVHTLFNVVGIMLLYPFPPIRRIPIRLAMRLADLATRNRIYVFVYIGTVFIGIPLLGILIFK